MRRMRPGGPPRWMVVLGSGVVLGSVAVAIALVGVPRAEVEPWVSAWTPSPTSRTLMIRAIGQDGMAGPCGPPQVRLEVRESATEVRVTARAIRYLGGTPLVHGLPFFGQVGCADVGYGPTSHAIALAAALGPRKVVDGASGALRSVLDASTSPTIPALPSDLRTTDLGYDDYDGVRVARRVWRTPAGVPEQFAVLVTTVQGDLPKLQGASEARVGGVDVLIFWHESALRDVAYLQWRLPNGQQANADLHLTHGLRTREQVLGMVQDTRA